MTKTTKIAIAAAFLLFLLLMVVSSLSLGQVKVEVCMEFNGRTECRVAAAPNEAEAVSTATSNACGLLASGRDQNIACSNAPPRSVRRLN
ncbi:MAG TPA: hypothetical protein VGA39_03975 [Candidatus Acidoferrales bacterium]